MKKRRRKEEQGCPVGKERPKFANKEVERKKRQERVEKQSTKCSVCVMERLQRLHLMETHNKQSIIQ